MPPDPLGVLARSALVGRTDVRPPPPNFVTPYAYACLKRCLKRPGMKHLSPGQTRMKVNKSGTLARVLSPTYVDFMHSHQPNRCTSREKSHADFRLPTLINSHSRLTAASICLPSRDPVNKRSSLALKSNPHTSLSNCNTKSCS